MTKTITIIFFLLMPSLLMADVFYTTPWGTYTGYACIVTECTSSSPQESCECIAGHSRVRTYVIDAHQQGCEEDHWDNGEWTYAGRVRMSCVSACPDGTAPDANGVCQIQCPEGTEWSEPLSQCMEIPDCLEREPIRLKVKQKNADGTSSITPSGFVLGCEYAWDSQNPDIKCRYEGLSGELFVCYANAKPTGVFSSSGTGDEPQEGLPSQNQPDVVTSSQDAPTTQHDFPSVGDTTTTSSSTVETQKSPTVDSSSNTEGSRTTGGDTKITNTTVTTSFSDGSTTTTTTSNYHRDSSVTITTTTTSDPTGGFDESTTENPEANGSTTTTTTTSPDGSSTTTTSGTGVGGDGSGDGDGEGDGDTWSPSAGEGPNFPEGGWWESEYPDGIQGIWNEKKEQLMNGPFVQSIQGLVPNIGSGGSCPSWSLNINGTSYELQPPCMLWDFLGLFFLANACFAAYRIIW